LVSGSIGVVRIPTAEYRGCQSTNTPPIIAVLGAQLFGLRMAAYAGVRKTLDVKRDSEYEKNAL
jgi:hypothetical protein